MRQSVIGKQTQYFLAESTKTLDLVDTQKSEVEGDGLWAGCAQVDKEGRLCEVCCDALDHGKLLTPTENNRTPTCSKRISLLHRNRSLPGQPLQPTGFRSRAAILQVLCWHAFDNE